MTRASWSPQRTDSPLVCVASIHLVYGKFYSNHRKMYRILWTGYRSPQAELSVFPGSHTLTIPFTWEAGTHGRAVAH